MASDKVTELLLSKLPGLTAEELSAIQSLPATIEHFAAGRNIARERERPERCFLIIQGMVGSFKVTRCGGRQIAALHLPGDMPDLHSLQLEIRDTGFLALSDCTLGFASHTAIHALCSRSYAIASALWRITLVDGSIFREWETNIGKRDAATRLAQRPVVEILNWTALKVRADFDATYLHLDVANKSKAA